MLLILVEVGVLVHVVCDVRLVAEHELVEGLVALVHILGEHVSHEPETRTGKHVSRHESRQARFEVQGGGRARRGCDVAHPLIWARLLLGKSLMAKNSLGTTMLWPTGSNVSGILLSGVKLSCSSVME